MVVTSPAVAYGNNTYMQKNSQKRHYEPIPTKTFQAVLCKFISLMPSVPDRHNCMSCFIRIRLGSEAFSVAI
jgi:hypothetical protein